MSLLYLSVRVFLAVLHVMLSWRATRAAKHYEVMTAEAEKLIEVDSQGQPCANKLEAARRQLKLSSVAAGQEKAEARALSCVSVSDRVGAWRRGVAGYSGRFCPYLLGKMDLAVSMLVAERYGYGTAWALDNVTRIAGHWF